MIDGYYVLTDWLEAHSNFSRRGAWFDADRLQSSIRGEDDIIPTLGIGPNTDAYFFYNNTPLAESLAAIEKAAVDEGFGLAWVKASAGSEKPAAGFRGAIVGEAGLNTVYGGVIIPTYPGCDKNKTCVVVYLFPAPYTLQTVGASSLSASSFMTAQESTDLAGEFGEELKAELQRQEQERETLGADIIQHDAPTYGTQDPLAGGGSLTRPGAPNLLDGRLFPKTEPVQGGLSGMLSSFPWLAAGMGILAAGSWLSLVAGSIAAVYMRDRKKRGKR